MPNTTPFHEKAALRSQLRKARRAIAADVRKQAGFAVTRLAQSGGLLARKRRIGLYVPAKGELDCRPLLDRALSMGAECYLPVIPHARQRKLWFSRLGRRPHWTLNRYGIPEYGHRRIARVRASGLDILFVPLLGFDTLGYRMGMGGGYYDTSLAYLARRKCWRRPRLIGLAFEAQKVERLPVDPWDIPLDAVITEKRCYLFKYRLFQ